MIKKLLVGLAVFTVSMTVHAQYIWTDTGGHSWSNTANWSTGIVPTAASDVQIATSPGSPGTVGIDTSSQLGYSSVFINSLTFTNTLSNKVRVRPLSGEQMTVSGAVANNSLYQQEIVLTLNAGVSATYSGGAAGLLFDSLNVGTKTIGTSGLITIASGGQLTLDINSLAVYGSIGGINATGASIVLAGTYTGNAGNTFNLIQGGASGATLDTSQIHLGNGLSWDTSQFASLGKLTVVPEPGTVSLLIFGACGLFVFRRHLRRSAV